MGIGRKIDGQLSEKDFLKFIVCENFMNRIGKKLDYKQCDIKSITPPGNCSHGYEIVTNRTDDFLRIHLYFTLVASTELALTRTELSGSMRVGAGDEVYVMQGELAQEFVDSGMYRLRWIGENPITSGYIMAMDGSPIKTMTGENLKYVQA